MWVNNARPEHGSRKQEQFRVSRTLWPLSHCPKHWNSFSSVTSISAKATSASFKDTQAKSSKFIVHLAGTTAVAAGHWCTGCAYTLLGKRKEISLEPWNELNYSSTGRGRVNIRRLTLNWPILHCYQAGTLQQNKTELSADQAPFPKKKNQKVTLPCNRKITKTA